jgi:hypothetical protein
MSITGGSTGTSTSDIPTVSVASTASIGAIGKVDSAGVIGVIGVIGSARVIVSACVTGSAISTCDAGTAIP